MGLPPSEVGAVQVRATEESPGAPDTPVGAPGGLAPPPPPLGPVANRLRMLSVTRWSPVFTMPLPPKPSSPQPHWIVPAANTCAPLGAV